MEVSSGPTQARPELKPWTYKTLSLLKLKMEKVAPDPTGVPELKLEYQ